jgi:hypothetical protein
VQFDKVSCGWIIRAPEKMVKVVKLTLHGDKSMPFSSDLIGSFYTLDLFRVLALSEWEAIHYQVRTDIWLQDI